jgi:plasmid maintenance system antidote protein VapI
MLPQLEKVKGVHPGKILERELKKQGIGNSVFAKQIGEYPTIITDLIYQRRGVNPDLSFKLGRALNAGEEYFYLLQSYYKIALTKRENAKKAPKPDMKKIRSALFWDINPENLDFQLRKRFIIERIFERGNEKEILEIISFYGKKECREILQTSRNLNTSASENAEKYL